MNEQVRHRAVQALEGKPGKVAQAGADTTQRHVGHALGGKAGNEAVAQVAHAADVDVAHRVVVSTRKDGEEVEVLRGSLYGVVRALRASSRNFTSGFSPRTPGLRTQWLAVCAPSPRFCAEQCVFDTRCTASPSYGAAPRSCAQGTSWEFVRTRRLLTNGTFCPIHGRRASSTAWWPRPAAAGGAHGA